MMDSRATVEGTATRNGLREVIRFLKRHKIAILAPAILFAGCGWMIASITPQRFIATSAITLNVGKVKIVDYEVVSRLPLETSTLRSEIDVIRSRSLNEEVVVKLGMMSNPPMGGDSLCTMAENGGAGRPVPL